jgi:glutathione S-transferase
MDRYRLHYFPESVNSYKLALMLTLCNQSFEPVWTDFGGRVTWTPEWRRTVNPMGEIPVLEENGVKLTQTGPILLHLAARFGRYGGEGDAARREILRWLFWDNQKLSGFMAAYRYMRTFVRGADPAVLAWHRARIDDFLGIVEQRLSERPFVIGDEATIADLSMCAYLSFPADETGYDLAASHPSVQAWLARIAALPGWRAPYDLLPGKRLRKFPPAAPAETAQGIA